MASRAAIQKIFSLLLVGLAVGMKRFLLLFGDLKTGCISRGEEEAGSVMMKEQLMVLGNENMCVNTDVAVHFSLSVCKIFG